MPPKLIILIHQSDITAKENDKKNHLTKLFCQLSESSFAANL